MMKAPDLLIRRTHWGEGRRLQKLPKILVSLMLDKFEDVLPCLPEAWFQTSDLRLEGHCNSAKNALVVGVELC